MERNYYMIRMTSATEIEYNLSFQKGFIAVGWSEVNLATYSQNTDAATAAVDSRYYEGTHTAPQTVGRKLNEIRRFLMIKENDVILLPYYSGIRIGIAEKGRYYDSSLYGLDLANCIKRSIVLIKIKDFKIF